MIIHPPTGRPMVDKMPVPYVTLWSAEANPPPVGLVQRNLQPYLIYPDDPDGIERDRHGLLWMRYPTAPSTGTPKWKQVHTLRARRSAHGRRCQVCAGKFADGAPLTFVFNDARQDDIRDTTSPFITMFTPTCRRCAPWAAAMCPNLRRTGAQFVVAHDVRPVGAFGDVYLGPGLGYPLRIMYGDPQIPQFLARQPLLRIADYHAEPMPELDRGARA